MASISPRWLTGLFLLISSMKITPGSPFFHAFAMMRSKTIRAGSFFTTTFVRGLYSSYSSPFSRASINLSVTATDMLKFWRVCMSAFIVMKSMTSGWSTRRIPMFAPRLFPPCLMTSVAASKTFMKDIGPDETPVVDETMSLEGRSLVKENPVPPPLLWIRAAFLRLVNIPSIESSTGTTKHAESCWMLVPAFIRVGEFGRNSRFFIMLKKSSSVC